MKEATGEANMTIITIVLISVVLAVGLPIVKDLINNTKDKTSCEERGLCYSDGSCGECPKSPE